MLKRIGFINLFFSIFLFLIISCGSFVFKLDIRPRVLLLVATIFFISFLLILYSYFLNKIKKIKFNFIYLFLFNIFILCLVIIYISFILSLPNEKYDNGYISLDNEKEIYRSKLFFYLEEVVEYEH